MRLRIFTGMKEVILFAIPLRMVVVISKIMDDLAGEVDNEICIGYKGIIATFNSYYGYLQIGCHKTLHLK